MSCMKTKNRVWFYSLLLTDLLRNPITMEWLEIESITVFDFEGYVFNYTLMRMNLIRQTI